MFESEYNPLDYGNLTKSCVEELMKRGPYKLPLRDDFTGSGVYALFYKGNDKLYGPIKSVDASRPIYVGKAVPPGARKGGTASIDLANAKSLYNRIAEHVASIEGTNTLNIEDFCCRYLVVTPLWITMAERFLIEYYQPAWNVCIEGFGNHDPGSGRHEGEISWWDCLHPGRKWAARLKQTKNLQEAKKRLILFFEKQKNKNV